ncbi:MAG TPA: hypothetical protein VFX44_10740 [Solirubrobacterales bacterium]|nr:hypothetical protein [Solirubrobacterales bacterium]
MGREIVFSVTAERDTSSELPRPPDDAVNLRLPQLSSRSAEVQEVLARQKRRPDRFYEGALRALADLANPVRAEMAAYALRELIQELERAASGPKKGPGLGVLLSAFRPKWEAAERRTSDRGLVDNCDPAVFAVDQFLDDAGKGHLSRRDRAQETLTGLDPVQRVGPPDIEEGRIEALLEFREEFDRVLHGEHPTDAEAFSSLVEGFETFLLAWFQPRTFEDFSEIDELLEEGPPT